jgi:hypothetical protein
MADLSYTYKKLFSASDIQPGTEMQLTIKGVSLAEVGQDKEYKPVAFFDEDPRGLTLNATRYSQLADAHGTKDCDKWVGAKVALTHDPKVKFKGKITGGLKIAVITPGATN